MNYSNIIAKLEKIKTPYYFYDIELLKNTLQVVSSEAKKYGYKIHYALKANYNKKILQLVKSFNIGADCVSGNEIEHAIICGFLPKDIVFAGVGKSDEEIQMAIDKDIFCFNCESLEELKLLNHFAKKKNKRINIALRINPNINAKSHHYIVTGTEENKFGISRPVIPEVDKLLKTLDYLNVFGLHIHIGSQVTDLNIFKKLCICVNELQNRFINQGYKLLHINVGGGLGINYEDPDKHPIPCFKKYFQIFQQNLKLFPNQTLHFELGRSIVGQCGNLISKVLFVKKGANREFIILDAGMNDLLRPALYHVNHKIQNLVSTQKQKTYDVVGPVCESSCFFGKSIRLPQTYRNNLMIIRSAGAYGEVMASRYNLRNIPKAYYSDEI